MTPQHSSGSAAPAAAEPANAVEAQPSRAAAPPAEVVPSLPPAAFTHQQIINAFFRAAESLNPEDPWGLLDRAGLSVSDLAADRSARYSGPPLDHLPGFDAAEQGRLRAELIAELRKGPTWPGIVEAPAGLALRSGPGAVESLLTYLTHGSTLSVLVAVGDWLFVDTGDRLGYAAARYVRGADETRSGATAPRYLCQDGALVEAALAPAEPRKVQRPPADGEGALLAGIWNRFGGLLEAIGAKAGLDPTAAAAVFAAETGPLALEMDGRLVIRFENHIFDGEWGRQQPEQFAQHFRYNGTPGAAWRDHEWRPRADAAWQPFHGDQDREWEVLTFAAGLDEAAAKRSTSLGLAQIMGFNHRDAGYAGAEEMFAAFEGSVQRQAIGFFDFVRSRPQAWTALQSRDFETFARVYNGPGQASHYAGLIRRYAGRLDDLVGVRPAAAPEPDSLPLVDFVQPAPIGTPVDAQLAAAWRDHIIQGFENNQRMFERILAAFMRPYQITIALYVILFTLGALAFAAAVILSLRTGQLSFALVFGGLSAAAFLSFFISKPLRSLEENLQFITWLGIVYNSYWARLTYTLDAKTAQQELRTATDDAVRGLEQLIDKSAQLDDKRPGLR